MLFRSAKGQGAFKQESTNEPELIHVNDKCKGKTVVACGRSHPTDQVINFLGNLGEHEIIRVGSALKSCMVAEGKADLYPRLGPTSEWDTAAAQCVVEEAGGAITDTKMQRLRYNTKDDLLNPDFFVSGDRSIKWNDFL